MLSKTRVLLPWIAVRSLTHRCRRVQGTSSDAISIVLVPKGPYSMQLCPGNAMLS